MELFRHVQEQVSLDFTLTDTMKHMVPMRRGLKGHVAAGECL